VPVTVNIGRTKRVFLFGRTQKNKKVLHEKARFLKS